ncbi:SRPBCC domain-containing protein [Streptomyces lonarensis]|uniref:Polyketide cyclase n=1 Tax=Streptomyces lonarensis TaxID=700599 RepID=A0A7X6D2M2_9ACTN|nr:SRPBCC domain-containing protein [Streptomyces lonarensis]NJQ06940.1 polyketide cyclase [Streptomyces lonarensis]
MTDRTPAPESGGEPLDLDRQAREVTRGVRPGSRDGRETEVVTLTQSHPVGREQLWAACTTVEGLARWMPPVSGELREGGRYQLDGNAGGRILRCDPPRSFTATWEYGGDTSWVTATVEPDPDDTARARLTLEHASVPDPAFRARYGPGATGVGWDLALSALAAHLAGAAASAGPDSAATDPAYQRFVAATATAWAEQDIVAGSPAEAARDAGRRTTAFFTGAPEPGDG